MEQLTEGLIFFVVFLFSTTLHEASHALAAKLGGDLTAYAGGQVSLDPIPHIRREPFGMLILPIITVVLSGWPLGFASAPYNIDWARKHPRRAAWMALAGPGANLLLVVVAGLLIHVGLFLDFFHSPASITFGHVVSANSDGMMGAVAFLLGSFFSLNLLLFLFNIMPLPPMDGATAINLLLPDSLIPRYQQFLWGNPALGFVGFLIVWQLFDHVWNPVFTLSLNLLYPGAGYH